MHWKIMLAYSGVLLLMSFTVTVWGLAEGVSAPTIINAYLPVGILATIVAVALREMEKQIQELEKKQSEEITPPSDS